MARVAILAHWAKFRVWVVRPNVRGLHASIALLAVCDGVPWDPLHPRHLPHPATWVFDKIEFRLKVMDDLQNMLIYFVASSGIFADGVKVAGHGVFLPMMAYCRNAECRTVRACPDNIGSAKTLTDVISCDGHYIGAKIDVFKVFVPIDGEYLVPVCFKSLAYAPCTGEQFEHFH